MKKWIRILTTLVMVSLLAVCVSASSAKTELNASVNGNTITVTVEVDAETMVKSMMIEPIYDKNVLEMQRGTWLVNGVLYADWSEEYGDAVISFDNNTDMNTNVFEMVFTVRDKSAAETRISADVVITTMNNKTEEKLSVSVEDTVCTLSASPADNGSKTEPKTPADDSKGSAQETEKDKGSNTGTAQDKTEELTEVSVGKAEWQNPFRDVSKSDAYYDAVRFVYENKLFLGVSATEFAPATTMTRGMFVTVLGRLAGVDEISYMRTTFTDVEPGLWYSAYVQWAAENGIVLGYGNGTFGPNDTITVEQAAVILARYADYAGVKTTASGSLSGYSDGASVSDWASAQMIWALDNGIYTADNGRLHPQDYAQRSLVASMLYHYVERFPD